jgi:hypothetical protein
VIEDDDVERVGETAREKILQRVIGMHEDADARPALDEEEEAGALERRRRDAEGDLDPVTGRAVEMVAWHREIEAEEARGRAGCRAERDEPGRQIGLHCAGDGPVIGLGQCRADHQTCPEDHPQQPRHASHHVHRLPSRLAGHRARRATAGHPSPPSRSATSAKSGSS